jgi:hypothetical protein
LQQGVLTATAQSIKLQKLRLLIVFPPIKQILRNSFLVIRIPFLSHFARNHFHTGQARMLCPADDTAVTQAESVSGSEIAIVALYKPMVQRIGKRGLAGG